MSEDPDIAVYSDKTTTLRVTRTYCVEFHDNTNICTAKGARSDVHCNVATSNVSCDIAIFTYIQLGYL